jgi:hypothetical protein
MSECETTRKRVRVPIRIQNKSNVSHFAITRLLLERNTELFKAFTRLLNVIDGNSDMTESSARVRVSTRVSLEVGVALSSVVVSEFQDT